MDESIANNEASTRLAASFGVVLSMAVWEIPATRHSRKNRS